MAASISRHLVVEAEGAGEEDEAGVEGAGGGVARGLLFA